MHDKKAGALTVREADDLVLQQPTIANTNKGFSMKLGTKISLGFAIITVILIGAVVTTIFFVGKSSKMTMQLTDLRVPTAQASLMMLNGMNHSLAALRGWIILGKDKFKEERSKAWSDEIDWAFGELKKYSVNWTSKENIDRLKIIEDNLGLFKQYQQEIEEIAQSLDNTPALKMLFEQAAPQAAKLGTNITKMIDLEGELEATKERKALLGMMADVRGTTGLGLANIRAYLISGDATFHTKFNKLWAKNVRRFNDLKSNARFLTPKQRDAFKTFSEARDIFEPLPPKMFKIRAGKEWNLANTWLGTKAAPTAFKIKQELDAMLENQQHLMETDKAEVKSLILFLNMIEWILLGVGIMFSCIVGFFITRSITKPINSLVDVIKEIAGGDFTKTIVVKSNDEIGVLSGTVNNMISGLRAMISNIKENARTIASASEELSTVSSQMASASEEMATQSGSVSSSTEQMSTNINTMASASEEMSVNVSTLSSTAEQMSQNMSTVASAIEEMSVSINDVSKNANEASSVANDAMEMSKDATQTMDTLGSAANEIGKVTEVIKRIAEQTNLLALNATIEAASAGEAGKGFAVVANEIKELANQSAQAAEDIATKIDGVQDNTSNAVKVINDVSKIIGDINKSVVVITNAVTEQTRAANDIATNVAQVNSGAQTTSSSVGEIDIGVNDMAKNAGEAAKAAADVAMNIHGVSEAANESNSSAQQIKLASSELAKIAGNMQDVVAEFNVG